MVFGVPGGVSFGGIFEKCAFFQQTVVPSILNDSTAFWLDFEGPGLLGGLEKQEKTASKKILIFRCEKRRPKLFFMISGSFLGSFWGALWSTLGYLFGPFLGRVSGIVLGPFLVPFWRYFGPIFGAILV
jgi:hypothetical protein